MGLEHEMNPYTVINNYVATTDHFSFAADQRESALVRANYFGCRSIKVYCFTVCSNER